MTDLVCTKCMERLDWCKCRGKKRPKPIDEPEVQRRLTIEPASRPVDDTGRESWRAVIRAGLPEGDRYRFDDLDFVVCSTCAKQPGSPTLCRGCLANRQTIAQLRELLGK